MVKVFSWNLCEDEDMAGFKDGPWMRGEEERRIVEVNERSQNKLFVQEQTHMCGPRLSQIARESLIFVESTNYLNDDCIFFYLDVMDIFSFDTKLESLFFGIASLTNVYTTTKCINDLSRLRFTNQAGR